MANAWDVLLLEKERGRPRPPEGSCSTDGNGSASCSSSGSSGCYYSREEMDRLSPSRRDGIDSLKETYLRHSYCTFLQKVGMHLQLPQQTIATAMVLCHRFFLRQSHHSNDRFVVATSCLFLAAKVEETPRPLNHVLHFYEICHRQDFTILPDKLRNELLDKHKELVLEAEQLVLTTLDFELTVHHPYTPLVSFFKRLGLANSPILQLAWNFVNDGLWTPLSLQFMPTHIAAAAASLAARVLNVELPSSGSLAWWQEFHTTPTIVNDVISQMMELYEQNRLLNIYDWNMANTRPSLSQKGF